MEKRKTQCSERETLTDEKKSDRIVSVEQASRKNKIKVEKFLKKYLTTEKKFGKINLVADKAI